MHSMLLGVAQRFDSVDADPKRGEPGSRKRLLFGFLGLLRLNRFKITPKIQLLFVCRQPEWLV